MKRTRVKKQPIYKRPVCSLAAAEVEENYTMRMTASAGATTSQSQGLTTVIKGKKVRDANRTIEYSTEKTFERSGLSRTSSSEHLVLYQKLVT